jgi:hypothetical protein
VPQPSDGCRLRFPFLNANPTRDQQRIDLAPKAADIGVARKRQSTHAGNLSIGARFLRIDDLDVVKWLAAHGPIRGSEDIDCPDQINFAYRWQSKEHDVLGLSGSRHSDFLGPVTRKVEILNE